MHVSPRGRWRGRCGAWPLAGGAQILWIPMFTLSSEEDKLCTASAAHRFVGPPAAAALCNAGSAHPGLGGLTCAVAVNVHALAWSGVCVHGVQPGGRAASCIQEPACGGSGAAAAVHGLVLCRLSHWRPHENQACAAPLHAPQLALHLPLCACVRQWLI